MRPTRTGHLERIAGEFNTMEEPPCRLPLSTSSSAPLLPVLWAVMPPAPLMKNHDSSTLGNTIAGGGRWSGIQLGRNRALLVRRARMTADLPSTFSRAAWIVAGLARAAACARFPGTAGRSKSSPVLGRYSSGSMGRLYSLLPAADDGAACGDSGYRATRLGHKSLFWSGMARSASRRRPAPGVRCRPRGSCCSASAWTHSSAQGVLDRFCPAGSSG